jgi:hypothetical protein
MSLPTLVVPTFPVKLFSQPKPISVRPYLVKEEKLLMIAQQGEDPDEIENAVRQIIKNCTFEKIDSAILPSFDLEYLFLQLRAKSVNNVINLKFRCQHQVAEKPCGNIVEIAIDINDIKLTVPEGHTNRIMLNEEMGVVLKYPTDKALTTGTDIAVALPQVLSQVFTTKGDVYEIADSTPQEIATFVESLTIVQVDKLREFFVTMPRLEHTFKFACTKCGYTDDLTLRGLQDFFD